MPLLPLPLNRTLSLTAPRIDTALSAPAPLALPELAIDSPAFDEVVPDLSREPTAEPVVDVTPRPLLTDIRLTLLDPPREPVLPPQPGETPPAEDLPVDLTVPVNPDLDFDAMAAEEEAAEDAEWADAGGMQLWAADTEAEHSDAHPGIVATDCESGFHAEQNPDGSWLCVADQGRVPLDEAPPELAPPELVAAGSSKWPIVVIVLLGLLALRK